LALLLALALLLLALALLLLALALALALLLLALALALALLLLALALLLALTLLLLLLPPQHTCTRRIKMGGQSAHFWQHSERVQAGRAATCVRMVFELEVVEGLSELNDACGFLVKHRCLGHFNNV